MSRIYDDKLDEAPLEVSGADPLHDDAEGVVMRADYTPVDHLSHLVGIGVSVFTILLMGLVGGLEEGGVMDRLHARLRATRPSRAVAEWWAFGAVSAAVILTTHSVVAILGVGDFVKDTGRAAGVSAYRRANILDITVCTYPFLLPVFIPTILASSVTASGAAFGMPRVSALEAGLYNFHSWALLVVLMLAVATGFGRDEGARPG